jgi:hypothetical protein
VEGGRFPWHPFKATIDQELVADDERPVVDFLGRSTDRERPQLDATVFVNLVTDVLDVNRDELCSRSRSRSVARVRRLVVTLGVERWRQNRTRLARVLRKNPDVLSWWASEGATLRQEDPEFAATLDFADEELSRRASVLSTSQRTEETS